MDRRRASSHLACLLVVELLVVVLLHRLGSVRGFSVPWSSLGDWLRTAPPEEVVAAAVRLVALAGAWWLLGTTVLYALTRVAGLPVAMRAVGRATLPVVRRWADRAFTATVVTGAALSMRPAAAASPLPPGPTAGPPPIVLELDHRDTSARDRDATGATPPPSVRTGRAAGLDSAPPAQPVPQTVDAGPAAVGAPSAAPPTAVSPPPGPESADRYEVLPGDSLWSIARTTLALRTERPPEALADAEIAAYWTEIVEANRDALRSGDPNLIFPGELLERPPIA